MGGGVRRPVRVRVCAAPEPRTRAQPLPRTDREVGWLEHRYAGRVRADHRATVEHALGAFREAEVVEFLGHGQAHPTAALDSALLLSDGDLTVRRLLGQDRCAARLVILSACESQVFDPRMTDEIIGLPLALHQAGASAVIAGQWTVDDIATALLMRRLHDALLRGAPAAEALATAQNWLRAASRKDLHDAYPDAYRVVGAGHSVRPFSDPAYWAGFTCSGYWTEGTNDG